MVFQAGQDPPRLWLRSLDSQEARPLAGTEGAQYPFWSPDSRSIGFTAGGTLKRIDLASGLVRTLARRVLRRGNMERRWNDPDRQQSSGRSTAFRQTVAPPKQATNLLRRAEQSPLATVPPGWPTVPALHLGTSGRPRRVSRVRLADATVQRVSDRESGYRLMPARSRAVRTTRGAVGTETEPRFHDSRGRARAGCPEGSRLPGVLRPTARSPRHRPGPSPTAPSAGETQLVWLDRTGRPVGTVGQADDAQMHLYQLSRDGRVVAVTRTIAGSTNVWLLDTERGVPRRLTFDVETTTRDPFTRRQSRRAPGEWAT